MYEVAILWLGHFATQVLGITIAILALTLSFPVFKRLCRNNLVDVLTIVDLVTQRSAPAKSVNVDLRDASGELLDLTPLIPAALQCPYGKRYFLRQGVFGGCDPDVVGLGTQVELNIGHGLYSELLTVRIDPDLPGLFVQSGVAREQLFTRLNRCA